MPGLLPLGDFEIQSAPFTSMNFINFFFFPLACRYRFTPRIGKLSFSSPRRCRRYKTSAASLRECLWLKHGLESRAAAAPKLCTAKRREKEQKDVNSSRQSAEREGAVVTNSLFAAYYTLNVKRRSKRPLCSPAPSRWDGSFPGK